jgi:hypothetical protein
MAESVHSLKVLHFIVFGFDGASSKKKNKKKMASRFGTEEEDEEEEEEIMITNYARVAFSQPYHDIDERLRAIDCLERNVLVIVNASKENVLVDHETKQRKFVDGFIESLEQEICSTSAMKGDRECYGVDSAIVRSRCFCSLKIVNRDDVDSCNRKFELITKEIFLDKTFIGDDDVRDISRAIDSVAKISEFLEHSDDGVKMHSDNEYTWKITEFLLNSLYVQNDDDDVTTTSSSQKKELYVCAVNCLCALAKFKALECFRESDLDKLVQLVERGTSVGDAHGTLACGAALRVLTFLIPSLMRAKRRKYDNNNNNNNNDEENNKTTKKKEEEDIKEQKMFSPTINNSDNDNNNNNFDEAKASEKEESVLIDKIDFNAINALVGKKTLQSGQFVPGWIKSAGCDYLGNLARKKEDFVLLAKASADKRHSSVKLSALKAFAKLGLHSRPYFSQIIQANQNDDICEIREQLCETLKKAWEGKKCEPKTDGTDDLKLFQTAECVGELMRDPDAGVRAKAIECLGYLRGAANSRRIEMEKVLSQDSDDTVREMAAESLARLGFLNVNTGEISAVGNYKTSKFATNKRLFLQLLSAADGGGANSLTNSLNGQDMNAILKLEKMKNIKLKEGDTIRIWWPEDEEWYQAKVVAALDKETKLHKICYSEDGVVEEIDMRNERVELRYKPHKKGVKETWVPCGNQEAERIREEKRKRFEIQKNMREVEKIADMELKREEREEQEDQRQQQQQQQQQQHGGGGSMMFGTPSTMSTKRRENTTTNANRNNSSGWKNITFSCSNNNTNNTAKYSDNEQSSLNNNTKYTKYNDLTEQDVAILRNLVNKKIKIYWPLDKVWYVADVLKFNEETRKLQVLYVEDHLDEEVELWTEKAQELILAKDLPHRALEGIIPLRVPVEVSKVKGFLEVGAKRGQEFISFEPPLKNKQDKQKKQKTGGAAENYGSGGMRLINNNEKQQHKLKVMKGADWEKKYNVMAESNIPNRRWRRQVSYNPQGWESCEESGKTASELRKQYGQEKMPLLKWLVKQGDLWGCAVIGKTINLDLNVTNKAILSLHDNDNNNNKNHDDDTDNNNNNNDNNSSDIDQLYERDWLKCKITDYNALSGEHLVCAVDEKGVIIGQSVWMPLVSQRSQERVGLGFTQLSPS